MDFTFAYKIVKRSSEHWFYPISRNITETFREWIVTLPFLTIFFSRYLCVCVCVWPLIFKDFYPGSGWGWGLKISSCVLVPPSLSGKQRAGIQFGRPLKDPDRGRLWFQQLSPLSYWLQAATIPPADLCGKWVRAGWAFTGAQQPPRHPIIAGRPLQHRSPPIYSFLCPSSLPPTHFSLSGPTYRLLLSPSPLPPTHFPPSGRSRGGGGSLPGVFLELRGS